MLLSDLIIGAHGDDFTIWIMDLASHQQERLTKGRHRSAVWGE
jgi:hypothetical protein